MPVSGQVPSGSSPCAAWSSICIATARVSSSGARSSGMLARRSPCSRNGPNRPTRTKTGSVPSPLRPADQDAAHVAASISSALSASCCFSPCDRRRNRTPQVVDVSHFAAADGVELVFHLGGEVVVDQAGQMGLEQLGHGKGDPGRHQRVAPFEDVLAGDDRVDDRGVGARPADPHLFERAGQGRFAVAWAAGSVLLRRQRRGRSTLRPRPPAAPFRGRPAPPGIVRTLDVGPQVAGELDRRAAGLELASPARW